VGGSTIGSAVRATEGRVGFGGDATGFALAMDGPRPARISMGAGASEGALAQPASKAIVAISEPIPTRSRQAC
jgi:hypothetical protein